jgi:hypothetical protein
MQNILNVSKENGITEWVRVAIIGSLCVSVLVLRRVSIEGYVRRDKYLGELCSKKVNVYGLKWPDWQKVKIYDKTTAPTKLSIVACSKQELWSQRNSCC